jgi:hypothetical protein
MGYDRDISAGQDSAFYDITNGIYKVVGQLTTHHALVSPIGL